MDVISQRSPPAAELQHPRQHADIHVDRAIGDAGVVTGALKVCDRRRRDRGERHVAKVLLDDAEPLLLEFDRASGAPDPFGSQVRVDGFRQPLRSLLVDGQSAVSSLFDHLALAPCGDAQIRRAEAFAVTTAVDREVRPVLATAFPEAHTCNSPSSESSSDEESDFVSTALARTKSSTSEGRYRTERPSRRNLGPLPRCRHARSVATESPSCSATWRSVSAAGRRVDHDRRSGRVVRAFMTRLLSASSAAERCSWRPRMLLQPGIDPVRSDSNGASSAQARTS